MEPLSGRAGHAVRIAPQIDALFGGKGQNPQIVDAMKLVGVIMGDQNPIQPPHPGIQRTCFFAEYGWTRLNDFGKSGALILSDRAWRFGLSVEF